MTPSAKAIEKLRRPPAVPNWVRYIHSRTDESAEAMVKFVLTGPRHSLQQVYSLISDMACLQVSLETALLGLNSIKSSLVRRLGREVLVAFDGHNKTRKYDGIKTLDGLEVRYPLGRGVFVPVKPSFIIVEEGGLTPVFVIGWATLPFTDFQKRLLSTIVHNALLTLTDFAGRDAEIVCLPRAKFCKSVRMPRAWKVSDYRLFSADELAAHLERYGNALDIAATTIRELLDIKS